MIVVFDLDGTLVDASRLHAKILSEIIGVDVRPEDVYSSSSLGFLVMKNLPKGKWSSIKDITRQHEAAMLENVRLVEPMQGVYKMLQKLRCKKAIFTSASRRLTDAIMEHCNLRGYFDMVVTKDDVGRTKPDPEGLIVISDELDDTRMVMVGNGERDLLAAKKFGIPFVLFSPSGKRISTADYVVSSLEDVPGLLDSLS